MKIEFLVQTPLFRGTDAAQAEAMLQCLGGFTRHYKKGETIYHAGSVVECLGLVLAGSVHIENDDIWGNKSIFAHIMPGQIFAETYACTENQPLLVNVTAAEDAEVLFLNASKIIQTCPNSCTHHSLLLKNLLGIAADKNIALSHRILYTTPKTIRGRLLQYLSHQAMQAGRSRFTIPFNRQQLADYLNVDRSALSAELSKMKREGILSCTRSEFTLYPSKE